MSSVYRPYEKFIESRLDIIDKAGVSVPFQLNKPQRMFTDEASGMDILLKHVRRGSALHRWHLYR